ncbi:NADPH2:quinone reductase [Nakamurella sp. UYEF19]|uniref:NADPH:quinone reductase n=1 Tax=Nakamurella sp. UYEF19 TaxID=1756392 RepID=UPI003391BE02
MTASTYPRAVVYSVTGGPEVLTLIEKPLLEPGPGQVRVRIHRSGVNPTDWKSRRGGPQSAAVEPAQVPGQDGAGVIDAVGPGVDSGRIGLRVWIWEAAWQRSEGTTQDFALIPEAQAVELPPTASFDLGAGLGIPFLTAHRCLTVNEDGPNLLTPGSLTGRHVLVAGGAGAVGNAAIQLAHWAGATVITTVSTPDKAQLAAAAGADHVIHYRDTDVAAQVRRIVPKGVETIVEVSAAVNAAIDAAVIADNGAISLYSEDGGSEMSLPVRPSMVVNARWQFVLIYRAPHDAKERGVVSVSAALADDAVRLCLPQHHFSLAHAAKAHVAVQESAVGKVLIDVSD